MPEVDLPQAEIEEIFGGEVSEIEPNADEIEVGLVLRDLRAKIVECAEAQGVGVNQYARRLGVAPSAVSRFLSGEADMRVSTVVLYTRALGYSCEFVIRSDEACAANKNFRLTSSSMEIGNSASTSTSQSSSIIDFFDRAEKLVFNPITQPVVTNV